MVNQIIKGDFSDKEHKIEKIVNGLKISYEVKGKLFPQKYKIKKEEIKEFKILEEQEEVNDKLKGSLIGGVLLGPVGVGIGALVSSKRMLVELKMKDDKYFILYLKKSYLNYLITDKELLKIKLKENDE